MRYAACALLFFLFGGAAFAQPAPEEAPALVQLHDELVLDDPILEARARAIQKQLRCVVCQGQSVDESSAPLAADMRRVIREQLVANASDDEIKNFFVARYGDFVLMEPPLDDGTLVLWFAPALLLLLGIAVIATTLLRSRRRLAAFEASSAEN